MATAFPLVCAGEAFEDLVFFGLPRVPAPGEELKTSSFLRTVGGIPGRYQLYRGGAFQIQHQRLRPLLMHSE